MTACMRGLQQCLVRLVGRLLWSSRCRRAGAGPLRSGVEGCRGAGEAVGVRAEVALVDDSLVVGDEGHDAGVAVLGGPRDDGEAADQVTVPFVAHLAAA